ncbi:DNA polymerase III delta prime subunit [Sporosarcina luteola]|nr:DNA polymerase III delta prime subunit [Sporosarcina luteola]
MKVDLAVICWIIAILAALQILLLVLLVWRKVRRNRLERKEQQRYAELLPEFISYLNGETELDMAKLKNDYQIAQRLASDIMSSTNDEEIQEKVRSTAYTALHKPYERALEDSSWPVRMNVLYYIQSFQMKEIAPLLQSKFNEMPVWDEEKKQMARTLASLGDISILPAVFSSIRHSQKFYRDVLLRFPRETDSQLSAYYEETDNPLYLCAYLQRIGDRESQDQITQVEEALASDFLEVRMQALKTIGNLYYMHSPDRLRPFFSSSQWQERMLVAQTVRKLNMHTFSDELGQLLGDAEWWVRYAAAESILEVEGAEKLKYYVENHPDSFARDMASQWLSTESKLDAYA